MADEQKKAAPSPGQPPQTLDNKYKETSQNYISLVNNFWRVDQQNDFNGNETRLYFYLVHVSNGLFWQNPFDCSYRQLATKTGISTSLLPGYMQRLETAGLIKVIPGKRGYSKLPGSTTQIFIGESIKYDTHTIGESIKYDTHNGESIKYDTHNAGVSIEKQAKTDTHTILKQNKLKQERKKSAPPPPELIFNLFKQKYATRQNPDDYKIEADKFINNYEFKNWRISGVKMTADNVETKINAWIMRYDSEFKRRDMPPTEPVKKMTIEQMKREY